MSRLLMQPEVLLPSGLFGGLTVSTFRMTGMPSIKCTHYVNLALGLVLLRQCSGATTLTVQVVQGGRQQAGDAIWVVSIYYIHII